MNCYSKEQNLVEKSFDIKLRKLRNIFFYEFAKQPENVFNHEK